MGRAARLRGDQAVGAASRHRGRRGHHRGSRTRQADAAWTPSPGRGRKPSPRRLRGRRRRVAHLLDHLGAVPSRPPRMDGLRASHRGHDQGGRRVGGAVPGRRTACRGRTSLAAHPAAAHPRGDGRDRRRADDLAARGLRRRTQLGLPLLLAARRRAHPRVAGRRRLHRRGAAVAQLAAPRGRGRSRGPADHVHRRWRPEAPRAHPGPPARLCRLATRPGRQRRRRAAPARRPRRGDDRAGEGPDCRA